MFNLKKREKLLQDIADGLKGMSVRLYCIEVVFMEEGTGMMATDLATALNYIANDIFWDAENGDWSDADSAVVRVI